MEKPKRENLVHEELFGAVKLEIRRFEGNTGQTFLKAKIARIYTDEAGKWKDTSYFSGRDLENVAKASAAANNFILNQGESPFAVNETRA